MVEINKDLLAPCGLYCGVCSIYIAHRDNNQKFKDRLMKIYKSFVKTVDDIACTGCLSEGVVFPVCSACSIKKCCNIKGVEGCYQCEDFPCKYINNFPIEVGKRVIMRTIPTWREIGTQKFVEEEERRYHCPNCGNQLFRGAIRCNKCGIEVNVD
jgi:predicted RNA-binding Zn-ribbon protein involved in translation (DUF1610 family)